MFRSFKAKNFRCFRELSIEPLERVNLIAGLNNLGKTALLEALFLRVGSNNPQLPLTVNAIRGIQQYAINPKDIWGWLFRERQIDQTIELHTVNEENRSSCVQIELSQSSQIELAAVSGENTSNVASMATTDGPRDLLLKFRDESGKTHESRATLTSDGNVKADRADLPSPPKGIYLSCHARPGENPDRFSNLERGGRLPELVETLRTIEPRLSRLTLLMSSGTPMIHGDIGMGELVPLPFMGEGMMRLLSIILAIHDSHGATVLIDEVENGLHHSVMLDVWKAIDHATKECDTQLFAATHSWECIQAAHEAFVASDAYDFRLHRLDRINGEIKAVTYDQESLDAAIKSELEVR